MGKHKVLKNLFKISEQKNYTIGDEIELTKDEFLELSEHGYVESGISTKKTPQQVDKEIKSLNKNK